ncbi:hypothetical protein RCL_jg6888.t1 [Rhizophagus clarus]|uniref:Uncharacterized protein n=1 Tax=Rhizophagus clarus TaxID=94130 RepID=A0A8H3QPJ7_9GLOM|nr:hypothetical protein RCL_jg6888.t1 [Rhizophagus clarus]
MSAGISVMTAWNFSRCFHSERFHDAGNHLTRIPPSLIVHSPPLNLGFQEEYNYPIWPVCHILSNSIAIPVLLVEDNNRSYCYLIKVKYFSPAAELQRFHSIISAFDHNKQVKNT